MRATGSGHPVAKRTMETVIGKAREHGAAFGAVRNSNHYGIAGYYAMMALEHDLVGMSSTNTVRYRAPTYGRDIMLGTNPFAYAVPAAEEPAFVLDFATTTVAARQTRGLRPQEAAAQAGLGHRRPRQRNARRAGRAAAARCCRWAASAPTTAATRATVWDCLPISCAACSRAERSAAVCRCPATRPLPGVISHWFAAFRIDGFRDVAEFKRDIDSELRGYKIGESRPARNASTSAGEIEYERTLENRKNGVPVHVKVWDGLEQLAREIGVSFESLMGASPPSPALHRACVRR